MSDRDLSKLFTIQSPCAEDWDSMTGTEVIRFCRHCELSVRDISNLTRKQLRRLVAQSGQRLCVRYVQPNPHAPQPVPVLHRISRRAGILAASAFTASISMPSVIAGTLPINPQPAFAQALSLARTLSTDSIVSGSATITGTVFDPNGAVITGANVSLTKMESNEVNVSYSDGTGVYKFEGLEPGTYNLKFEAKGFAPSDVPNLTVRASDSNRIDQTLSIATVTASVEITAQAFPSVVSGAMAMVAPTEPIVKAADDNDLEGVNEALRLKPNVNIRDKSTGNNALECAVRNANREIIQALLWSKADVNSRDSGGQTPLMMLGEQSTTDLVWDLLNAGAKVNLRDEEGETALMTASAANNAEVLRTLLDAGAQVNGTNNEGKTALMVAASEGYVNNIRVLILAGADVNARDKEGKTALEYAQEGEHPAAIRLLKQHGAMKFADVPKDQ